MEQAVLVAQYPFVYHAATAGSWESMRRHGLLSAKQLVATSKLPAATARRLLTERRKRPFMFAHPALGRVSLRDHKPLQQRNLKLTDGWTLRDWLEVLNDRVYFWLDRNRLSGFLNVYKNDEHDVLTVDTKSLVEAHRENVRLSRINSGASLRSNAPIRGPATFQSIDDYPFDHYRRTSGTKKAIAELTVVDGVLDLDAHVVTVERFRGAERIGEVYRRPDFEGSDGG